MGASLIPIKRRKFEKFLEYIGCVKKRTKGDHIVYSKPGLKRPIIIVADTELSKFHIRSNLKTLGMSIETFLEILDRL